MSAKLAMDLYRSLLIEKLEAQLKIVRSMQDTDFAAGEFAGLKLALRLVLDADVPDDMGVSYRGRPGKAVFPDVSIEPEASK